MSDDERERRRVTPMFVERNSAYRIDPILAASIIVEEPSWLADPSS